MGKRESEITIDDDVALIDIGQLRDKPIRWSERGVLGVHTDTVACIAPWQRAQPLVTLINATNLAWTLYTVQHGMTPCSMSQRPSRVHDDCPQAFHRVPAHSAGCHFKVVLSPQVPFRFLLVPSTRHHHASADAASVSERTAETHFASASDSVSFVLRHCSWSHDVMHGGKR